MIEMNAITKSYGKNKISIKALNQINLKINNGEMVAITGPSGSGKSTLLNILGLIDRPSTGSYILESIKTDILRDKEIAALRNKKFGFIVQDFALIEEYTVFQNIEIPLIYSYEKLNKEIRKEKVREVLKLVNLNERLNTKCNELSGGQRQRIAICRAIINNPDVILADEPTGALDSKTSLEIMNIFLELNKKGKTIIIITHDEKIANYCNRILELKDGQIISDNKKITI